MNILTIFSTIQLIGGIILAIGYFPQIKKIIRTKSASDFHLPTFVMLSIGIGMMESYAITLVAVTHAGHAFLATNTLSFTLVTIMAVLIKKYGTNKA